MKFRVSRFLPLWRQAFTIRCMSSKPEAVAVPDMSLTHVETGAFKKGLPDIFVGQTHYRRALRSLADVIPDKKLKNLRDQNRKHAAHSLDTLMKALTGPLTEVLAGYKNTMKSLHPFEATVANLTVIARQKQGLPHLNALLKQVALLRKETSVIAKLYASEAKKAASISIAREMLEKGKEELKILYEDSPTSTCLSDLYELQRALRRIPVIELNTPSVVLVGAPNVGKSSLVRELSSGLPEVNDYPFTTRGVTIGHIIDDERIDHLRFQVMDTPGLLDRPERQRNEMEKLTYASMAHLPTAVVFVIDPTGLAGDKSSLDAQLNVRTHLKKRFPQRPWVDVVSKGDIEITEDIISKLPKGYVRVSVVSKQGVETVKGIVKHMLCHELPSVLHPSAADEAEMKN